MMIIQEASQIVPKGVAGRKLVKWTTLDSNRRYVTDDPTVSKFVSLLRQADDGDVGGLCELNEEMQAKDSDYQGLVGTRKAALNALDWCIVPDTTNSDLFDIAEEAASYVSDILTNLETFEDTLVHLAEALFTNVAVSEIIWDLSDKNNPILATNDVPGHRLRVDPQEGPDFLIEMEVQSITDTIKTTPGKFIVHTPNPRAGFPIRVNIARAQAWIYLIKHYCQADWAAFSEVFGMPQKLALCREAVIDNVRDEIEKMFQNCAADGYGVFPEGVDFKFLEANRGNQPYSQLLERLDKRQQVLILGQTLTTDTSGPGSFALGKVHDNVRTDILISDIKAERTMLRHQLIAPLISLRFPSKKVPLPIFQRKIIETKNLDAERLELEKLKYMDERGLPVDEAVIYERLGFPKPKQRSTQAQEGEVSNPKFRVAL